MFTVIIANETFNEKIEEYRLFLEPFLKQDQIGFCTWHKDQERFYDMVPQLSKIVGRRREWRAIIVCDENNVNRQNPFDCVPYEAEPKMDSPGKTMDEAYIEAYKAYLERAFERKIAAYECAAKQPLTRLVTFMCDGPTVTDHASKLEDDIGYLFYKKEMRKKKELREQIIQDEMLEIAKPSEVYCIASRTYNENAEEFDAVWSIHTELEYSRFYDRNLYFDKMRYLIFDILPENQREYKFDYIRFLYVTLLLASNEIPSSCLAANRVYQLNCETDENSLKKLLSYYEAKLDFTEEQLEDRIETLTMQKEGTLTDSEANRTFCGKATVPVIMSKDYDVQSLHVDAKRIGLANGAPAEEEAVWESGYARSKKGLHQLLKQSHRALKRAASDARHADHVNMDRVGMLNEMQMEDIKEFVDTEELAMVRTATPDLYDEEQYLNEMEPENADIHKTIQKRMHVGETIAVAAVGIVLFLLGFFTLLFLNLSSNAVDFAVVLLILFAAFVLITGVALAVLFVLRHKLVKKLKHFNHVMDGVDQDVRNGMQDYSCYLGHLCGVRRGFSVINTVERHENPNRRTIVLYHKHIQDIESAKASCREVFGAYMGNAGHIDSSILSPYDYNYDKPLHYLYPLPYSDKIEKAIEFIQPGVTIRVPVDFIKQIGVRREELYD